MAEQSPNLRTAASWHEPPPWLPAIFHSFCYPSFLLLWLGQVTRSLAMWMDVVARPILVLAMTGSAVQLGLFSAVRGIPTLLIAPFAGVLADRLDRRLVMIGSKLAAMAVTAAFAILVLRGQVELWHIYVTAIIKGLAHSFDRPARQALLPSLVPPHLLVNALALNSGSMQIIRILSASVAGFTIALWSRGFGFGSEDVRSFGGVYVVITLCYLISLLSICILRVPLHGQKKDRHREPESWQTVLAAGFRFAWQSPVILSVFVLLAVKSLFGTPYIQVFIPWLSLQVMDIGAEGMGVLIGLSGLGSLAGATIMAGWGEQLRRRGTIIIGGLVIYGAALGLLGATATLAPVTVMGLVVPVLPVLMIIVVGLGQSAMGTLKNAVLMEYTPDELRGRIFSIQSLDKGLSMLGSAGAGFAVAVIGGPAGLALYGALCVISAFVVAAAFPALRQVD